AAEIRAKGLLPGLWLAPFVAAENSELVKNHPDWLLQDGSGRPVRVDKLYALNFYNGSVRDYLSGIFHIATEKWGYELLQLDWLFAVCLAPPPGKTRGAVMYEAMEFLRRLAGPKRILAAAAPLGSCFGLVDYCQVGSSRQEAWENRWPAWLRFRERASTLATLRSILGRWQLNGLAFHLDPGGFSLQEIKQSLSLVQQHTVLIINTLLGNLLVTSDDPGQYSPEQTAELEGAWQLRGSRITAVREIAEDLYKIDFIQENEHYSAYCNLTNKARFIDLERDKNANGRIEIQPFETMILRSV
ncbi:MAG: alpha-galactosidase, partial [Saprospiraceae bacterium]